MSHYAYPFEKGMSSLARDTRALTDEVEHFDEPSSDVKRAARRVIAANSADPQECLRFLSMCGLHPDQWDDPVLTTSAARIV